MKKLTFVFISLVILVSSLLFSSCKDNEIEEIRAEILAMDGAGATDRLAELSAERVKAFESSELEYTLTIDMYTESGMTIDASTVGVVTEHQFPSPIFDVKQSVDTNIRDKSNNRYDTYFQLAYGYQSGNMYRTYESDALETKLYSEITAADYFTYIEGQNAASPKFTSDEFSSFHIIQNEDYSWVVELSTLKDEAKDLYNEVFDVTSLGGTNFTVSDVEAKIVYGADFAPVSFDLSVYYLKGNVKLTEPVVTLTASYRKINAASTPSGVDTETFTKIADLRLLDSVSETLTNYIKEDSGKFTSKVTLSTNDSSTFEETDKVSFSHYGDALEYEMMISSNGVDIYKITYADKKQTVEEIDWYKYTSVSTNAEQEAFLRQYLNRVSFDTYDVTNFTLKSDEEGVQTYTVTFSSTNAGAYLSAISNKLPAALDGTITMECTFDGQNMLGYVFTVSANDNDVAYVLVYTVTLGE